MFNADQCSSMNNKFDAWNAAHSAAIARINEYLKPNKHHAVQMNDLVEWMINTDINPFAYLPAKWASSVDTATGFVALLDHIHHALYDDGDITFVTVNDEPRIVFANQYANNFNDDVITTNDRAIAERRGIITGDSSINIVVLDITPGEFGPLREKYDIAMMKRAFAFEAARRGVDFAVSSASVSKLFNPAWIEECAEQIAKYRKIFN